MQISSKLRSEIAEEYKICTRTLNRWINRENLDIPKRVILTPLYVKLIYATFGDPPV